MESLTHRDGRYTVLKWGREWLGRETGRLAALGSRERGGACWVRRRHRPTKGVSGTGLSRGSLSLSSVPHTAP